MKSFDNIYYTSNQYNGEIRLVIGGYEFVLDKDHMQDLYDKTRQQLIRIKEREIVKLRQDQEGVL